MSDFDIESDNDDLDDSAQSLDYLKQYNYQSKDDIIFAVAEYHTKIERRFVVTKSDKRRYYVKCAAENCGFYLKYNYRKHAFCPGQLIPAQCLRSLGATKLLALLAFIESHS
jgi:hypothetical protein